MIIEPCCIHYNFSSSHYRLRLVKIEVYPPPTDLTYSNLFMPSLPGEGFFYKVANFALELVE